jgi:ATP dependent DNA ligase C terminal region
VPLDKPPPRSTRFGSPLVLLQVKWVKPKLVAQVKFLTWTADGLFRQVSYLGLREDKLATEVRRPKALRICAAQRISLGMLPITKAETDAPPRGWALAPSPVRRPKASADLTAFARAVAFAFAIAFQGRLGQNATAVRRSTSS